MIDTMKLIESALEAQLKAICPYSNYPVGAALLSDDNNIIIGFNIESKAYPTTLCLEASVGSRVVKKSRRRLRVE